MSNLLFGLQVAVIGMGVVFIALIILSYATSILSRLLNENQKKEEKEIITQEAKINNVKKVNENKKNEVENQGKITSEKLAVITAAVYESMGGTRYKITAVRKIPKDKTNAWNQAGRFEQMESL
jgi:sodium pump decarboxylase gamma subunit